MFEKLKRILKKEKSLPKCRTCTFRLGGRRAWFCCIKFIGRKHVNGKGYRRVCMPICGYKKVKTSPKSCPYREEQETR